MNPIVKLGDVATVITKGTTPTTVGYQFVESGIPFLRAEDVSGGFVSLTDAEKKITPECHKAFARSQLQSGDLLITIAGSVGRVGIVPDAAGTANCNQAVSIVRLKPGLFDLQFLCYFLRTSAVQQRFRQQGTTATITNVSLSQIKDVEVPLLPLPEQRRIVDLLSRAEGIVRLRREAEKKAAELIPALFLDMFGDPATNPKGWAKSPLGDLCTRITDGTHQPPKFQETGIPFIFVANIVDGELSLDAAKFISEETYAELTRRCPIERDDVLYSTVGSYGVPVKVDTDERFSFQRHIAHLKPDRDKLDSDFLVGMLTTPALQAQANMAARGIAQKTINLGEIRKFQVITPPIKKQRQFASQVAAARSIHGQQSDATAKAKAAFDALLAQALAAA